MRCVSDPERRPTWASHPLRRLTAGFLAAVPLASGCDDVESVTTFEPITEAAELFMALTLDHRAINLSTADPYNTLQLEATPRNALGEPMDGLPAPIFHSSDTTRVWVSPEGLLQARDAATEARVIAELRAGGNVRHADTAYVNVTTDPTPPELATFSITPETPEAAAWPVIPRSAIAFTEILASFAGIADIGFPSLPLQALDGNGDPIPGLAIEYQSLNPEIVQVGPRYGDVSTPRQPGKARIVARTIAYGVTKIDTAQFIVGLPRVQTVGLLDRNGTPRLEPTEVTVRAGGYVFWVSELTTPMDVTFEDPANIADIPELCAAFGSIACSAGDISAFAADTVPGNFLAGTRARRFPVPGVYEYESTLTGHTGRVTVVAEGPDAANTEGQQ